MYLVDDQAMARHTATYLGAVKRLNGQEHVTKYSGSPLTIRPG
jgi:23S rRNA A2030 N6-methylase RlmJ